MAKPNIAAPNPAQANAAMRQLLVSSSPRMVKKVGTFTGTVGGNTRIKLFNVGLITRLFAKVTIGTTVGTATATVSKKGLPAAITRLKITDYDGSDRVNATGFQLEQLNSFRVFHPSRYGYANVISNVSQNVATTAVTGVGFTMPSYTTAVSTGNDIFFLEVPIARDVDKGDLRGMILAQTTVGELYCSIDWASVLYANGDDDKVFNGAGTTTVTVNSISVDLYQEYYLPQVVNGIVPIPQLDTMTVYELVGGLRSSDNLATGSEKLLSFPNVRQIHGVYVSYLNNNVLGGSAGNDLTTVRLIANGNNVLREYEINALYNEMRRALGTDLPLGVYALDFATSPLQTSLYGNLQLGLTPGGTVTAGASVEIMYESLYMKGQALSGISQSG